MGRVEDGDYPIARGDYSKFSTTDGVEAWMVVTPDGDRFVLANRLSPDHAGRVHEVEEHGDGTISVLPQPSNSNSILSPSGWHGYIRHGVWEKC